MNQENKVVKISDVIENQIPEFIVADNPNFVEFLNQYYISQEFQGSNVDLVENLVSYKNIDSFDNTNLISETTLSSAVGVTSTIINVTSTKGWPDQYGLLKINNEIVTYTGITSTSFTGCIRGFSGISSLTQENNPEVLVFSSTEARAHASGSVVHNLSNLFLKEFFRKIKYQFTPGFEELEFAPQINPQNFISKARSFYQTKGTNESFNILFKVLYAEDVKVIKPNDYCFTPSDDKWKTVETFVCELVSGDPFDIEGQTLYQDKSLNGFDDAYGSIYNVEEFKSSGQDFYKLHIFSGYSNNLNPKGSIYGTFVPTPKTFCVENATFGSNIINVDSTVGFPNSGTLEIGNLKVTYTDKTNNQFLNCSGINSTIFKKSEIFSDHFVYAYEKNSSNVVKFKVCTILSAYQDSDALYLTSGDPIKIESLGSTEQSVFSNSLIYNLPINIFAGKVVSELTAQIRVNQKQGLSLSTGNVLCQYAHQLKSGDVVDLHSKLGNVVLATNLQVTVVNSKEFIVPPSSLPQNILGKLVVFKRHLKKSPYNNLNFTANIQDSYVDEDSYYLTSNGLPEYQITPFDFTTEFFTNIPYALDAFGYVETNFKTGDEVSVVDYQVTQNYRNEIGISTGRSYYVTRLNTFQIRLSDSKENVGISSYIIFQEYDNKGILSGKIDSIELQRTSHYNQEFNSGKLFKKIPKNPKIAETKSATNPGSIGIFANGVELRNYKSFDKVYYGEIESVTILNSGTGYDLTNPPRINVENGVNSNIMPHMKGDIIKIIVEDSGFDYIETPTVDITGGNNSSVVTSVKMKNIFNEIKFNATTKDTVINTADDLFNFKKPHRFVTGEPIIYKNFGSTPIGIGTATTDGFLSNNSVYYAVNVGAGTSIKLAFTKNDAIQGKNLILLRTFGGGTQSFTSTIKKQGIEQVNIVQSSGKFETKKLSFLADNVNLLDNIITIENHGFLTGEEVVYSYKPLFGFQGGTITGLTTNTNYYIDKLDNNKFRLSTTKNITDQVDLQTRDFYTTYFIEYSPIKVKISGTLSVTGITTVGYAASLTALIQGSIVGAYPQKNPSVEGSIDVFGNKDVLNWEDAPKLSIIEGSGASFQPIIDNGAIKKVIVKSSGSGYFNTFEFIIKGDGFGAKLYPIINNGQIVNVIVVNGGVNYSPTNTRIDVIPVGRDAKLKANITSWTVNGIEKYGFNSVEDGAIFGRNYSLFGTSYGVYHLNENLRTFFNIPNTPTAHSPIVGWSYDGCPIYGPYGYTNSNGSGGISRMRSGYAYQNVIGSSETLVEQYFYSPNIGTLDKYNGRYCVTPEYPNGVYAYFCTFDENNVPEFPYVIGPEYNYLPVKENFDLKHNQSLNFNNLNIVKWTTPYRIEDDNNRYEYFEFLPNQNENDVIVEKSSSGTVDEIRILDGGIDYQVGDSLVFDNDENFGFGAIAKVSEVDGVGINTITTQISTIQNLNFTSNGAVIVGIATTYHSLKNNSYVTLTGISTSLFKNIEGIQKIVVNDVSSTLSVAISTASVTGIITSIQIADRLDYFDIDSQLIMNGEILTVIGKDYKNNLLNVKRTVGGPSHVQSEVVTLLQNKFQFVPKSTIPTYTIKNDSYYFYSSESVSVGTTVSVGLGNTLTIYPLGAGLSYSSYIPHGGIYLPNNVFNTGDKINYFSGSSPIVTNKGDLTSFQNLYVLKISNDVVGIVTIKSQISDIDNILTYTSSGSSDLHKFRTDRNVVTGSVQNVSCVVSTAATHGLSANDIVSLKVTSGITTTYNVTYNNQRLLINSENNPKLNVYSNDTVIFDLSSNTLSGKIFNLYEDENFLNPYVGNKFNGIEVTKTPTQLTLSISDYTPKTLYYTLSDTLSDISVSEYNKLCINDSLYNLKSSIFTATDRSFTINLNTIPERLSYTSPSTITYSVLSGNVLGSIFKIDLVSKGFNYIKLPQILSVTSDHGSGCSLFANSKSLGKVEKAKINNTSLICPFDKTLKPKSKLSSLKLIDNYYVKELNLLSNGSNYINPPHIKLYNKKDNQLVDNFSAAATLKNSSIDKIEILNPGFGLKSSDNKIVSVNNQNGVKIINALITGSSPYTITLTLKTPVSGFTTSNPLPFSTGDEIFVEGMVADGFNTSQNNFEPFIATSVDPAYGSQDAATIQYQTFFNPGSYNSSASYNAYVIPYSNLPNIEAVLEQNEFSNKEYITNDNVQIISNSKNSPITNLVKTKNSKNIIAGNIITGRSSRARGTVVEIDKFNFTFNVDSSVSETLGGFENRGYLSSNIQKLSDNDYYQKFSYSLKSKKQFSTWNSPVSDIAHISGYKKFSDLSIESIGVGASVTTTAKDQLNLVSITNYADVNAVSDFDLAQEIDLDDTNNVYSQYLKLGKTSLGNSLKSTHNRVLSIDDISNLFINQPTKPSIPIDSVLSSSSNVLKYEFYLTATNSFLGDFVYPEIFELLVCRSSDVINLTSYSYYYDTFGLGNSAHLGDFIGSVNPANSNEVLLSFQPTNPFLSIDIKAIKESVPSSVGIATTSFGYAKNVELCQTYGVGIASTSVIYTIPTSDCNSGTIIVGVSSIKDNVEYSFEASFVNTSDGISVSKYAEAIYKDLGIIGISTNGSNIEFTYSTTTGIGVTVQANLKLLTNTYVGYDNVVKNLSLFTSSKATTTSLSSGISTVSGDYGYTKYLIEVVQNTGITTNKSIVQLNSVHYQDYMNNILYDINGNVDSNDLNFETTYNIGSNTYTLFFNPVTAATYTITTYESSLLSPSS